MVVETGVLYGASSAHILAALAQNGDGELHSIELGRDSGNAGFALKNEDLKTQRSVKRLRLGPVTHARSHPRPGGTPLSSSHELEMFLREDAIAEHVPWTWL